MALADTYEELTAGLDRGMRVDHPHALEQVVRNSGRQLDPVIVEAFVARQADFDQIRSNLAEHGQEREQIVPGAEDRA